METMKTLVCERCGRAEEAPSGMDTTHYEDRRRCVKSPCGDDPGDISVRMEANCRLCLSCLMETLAAVVDDYRRCGPAMCQA